MMKTERLIGHEHYLYKTRSGNCSSCQEQRETIGQRSPEKTKYHQYNKTQKKKKGKKKKKGERTHQLLQ